MEIRVDEALFGMEGCTVSSINDSKAQGGVHSELRPRNLPIRKPRCSARHSDSKTCLGRPGGTAFVWGVTLNVASSPDFQIIDSNFMRYSSGAIHPQCELPCA